MIPHTMQSLCGPPEGRTLLVTLGAVGRSRCPCRVSAFDPAFDVALLAGADRERAGRHVLADRRAGADVGVLPHGDRRDELRVAADERAVLDRRGLLADTVVVAGDRAGADV